MVYTKPEILIYNYSRAKLPQKLINATLSKVFNLIPDNNIKSIAIIGITADQIKKINYQWRKINKPTTIITFLEGDIFICPQEIQKYAQQQHLSLKNTYQLLLIHGILHLLGHTHNKFSDTLRMQTLEQELFKKIK